MKIEDAYRIARSLTNNGNEDLIEAAIPDEKIRKEIMEMLEVKKATQTDSLAIEDVVNWYSNLNVENQQQWPRYYNLVEKKWGEIIANSIDNQTTDITNHISNPSKRNFECHGLVVGHVQSGKTANYTGVIAKAVDGGYNFVIVLAGLHNNLRDQTQKRLDKELTGEDETGNHVPKPEPGHQWTNLTWDGIDFFGGTDKSILQWNSPILCVLKKNCTVLRKFRDWLKSADERNIKQKKVLIIDDEADHGSINIGRDGIEKSKNFYKKLKIKNLKIYFDKDVELANQFLLRGLPTTVFINKKGEEFARVIGFVDFDDKKIIKWLQKYD